MAPLDDSSNALSRRQAVRSSLGTNPYKLWDLRYHEITDGR